MAPQVPSLVKDRQFPMTPAEHRRLRHAFRKYDKDGDGRISKTELFSMLHCFGSTCTEESVQELIDEIDKNKDGFVDFEEFVYLSKIASHCSKPKEDMRAVFQVFDLNGDGKISPKELHKVMADLGDKSKSLLECQEMIAKWDNDGDGSIDQEEFEKMMSEDFQL